MSSNNNNRGGGTVGAKTRRRFSKQESTIIQRLHREHDGKWNAIMEEPAIRAMAVQSHQIDTHLRNLAKTARKKIRERPKRKAKRTVNYRAAAAGGDEEDDDGSEASIDSDESSMRDCTNSEDDDEGDDDESLRTNSDDDESDAPQGEKRKRVDVGARPLERTKKQRHHQHPGGVGAKSLASARPEATDAAATPTPPPRDNTTFATTVASLDVQSMEDMVRVTQRARAQHKKDTAVTRVKKERETRGRETNGLMDSLQQHQSVMESQGAMQATMQMQALRMMKKLARDIEEQDEEARNDSDGSSMTRALTALHDDVRALREEVTALRAQLTAGGAGHATLLSGSLFDAL